MTWLVGVLDAEECVQEGRDDLADLREGEMVEALTISSSEQTTLTGKPPTVLDCLACTDC